MELEQTIGLDQVVDSSPVTDQQTIPNNISFNPDHPDNKIASLTERLDPPPPTGLVKNTEQTSITSPTSAKLVINWDQATIPTTDDKSTTTDPIKFYILYSSLTPDTKLENKNIIDHYLALPGHKQGRAVIPVTDSRQTQYLSLVAVDIHGRHSVPSTELVVRAADDTKPAPIVIKKITRKTLNDLTEKVTISWQASPDSDIYAYHIYTGNSPLNLKLRESRTTKPHFKPPPFSFIQKLSPAAIYVRIVAEDTSGNLSLSPVSNE